MVIAIVSVVYSALRAGSNNRTFMSAREEAVEEGLLAKEEEGTSAGLDGEPQGQSMGKHPDIHSMMTWWSSAKDSICYCSYFVSLLSSLIGCCNALLSTKQNTVQNEE